MSSNTNKPRPIDEARMMKPTEPRKSSPPFGGAVVTRVRERNVVVADCGAIVVAIVAYGYAVGLVDCARSLSVIVQNVEWRIPQPRTYLLLLYR